MLKPSCIPKNSLIAYLIMEIAVKKTLKLGFGRRPQNIFNFLLHFLFSYIKSKLHNNKKLPRCHGGVQDFFP